MRNPTTLISVIAGCLTAASVSGQVSHHSPVIHHGSAKSFQSFTYFGRNSYPASQAFSESAPVTSSIKYAPPATKAPYVAPTYVPLGTPNRYNPAAARSTPAPYNPAPAPVSYSTAPAPAPYKPASVTYNSVAAPSPVPYNKYPAPVPASYNPSLASVSFPPAPAPYKPASVTYNSVAAPAPFTYNKFPAPAPAPYKPASVPYNSVAAPASFTYNKSPAPVSYKPSTAPVSYSTAFTISSTPFVPTELRTDIPASEIVDAALEDVKNEGPRLVEVVAKIQNNRLIKRIFNTVDPCNSLPENIAEVLEKMNEAAISSRSDLINIIAAAQEMKKNENNTQVVLLEASNALLAINPLLPIFREIFPKSEGCGSNIQATVVGFNQIGNLLEVLGTTNLVSTDDATKSKITKGGQTTKILADLAKKLEEGGFTSLCEGSPTFSSDVLMGVSELLKAFEKIADAFDAKSELSDLGKTVAVIRDGAELLRDLNFEEPKKDSKPSSGGDCVTSIPAVAKTLEEVADLASIIKKEDLSK